jgi:hypothetical protein
MVADFDETFSRLLDSGVALPVALELAVRAAWRGAEEDVQWLWPDCSEVRCVCGVVFRFKDGATRARCPGCGARYEKTPTPRA